MSKNGDKISPVFSLPAIDPVTMKPTGGAKTFRVAPGQALDAEQQAFLANYTAPSPRGAQAAEQASGEESPTRGLPFPDGWVKSLRAHKPDVDDAFEAWFDEHYIGHDSEHILRALMRPAFLAGAWWAL